jgi:hypothetical protein
VVDRDVLDTTYARLLSSISDDETVLGFALVGSRGKGFEHPASDYDFVLIAEPAVVEAHRARCDALPAGFDPIVATLEAFEASAAWGAPDVSERYSYAHVVPLLDRTGGVFAEVLVEKARVPDDAVAGHVAAALDHFVNQVFRSCKAYRTRATLASHLEAAEGIGPLLDAWFALDDRRLRPYPKYLAWELRTYPVAGLPWSADGLLELLERVLGSGDIPAQQELLRETERVFRAAGYGDVFDAWEGKDRWCIEWEPRQDLPAAPTGKQFA